MRARLASGSAASFFYARRVPSPTELRGRGNQLSPPDDAGSGRSPCCRNRLGLFPSQLGVDVLDVLGARLHVDAGPFLVEGNVELRFDFVERLTVLD